MTTPHPDAQPAVSLFADHQTIRRVGNWTTAGRFVVRARHSTVLLDLRSPGIPADPAVDLTLDHATLVLLLPGDMVIDHTAVSWSGRGRIHDRPLASSRRTLQLGGHIQDAEIRVRWAGMAILTAMASRE